MTTSQQLARPAIFFAVVFSCSPSSAAKFIDFFTTGLDTMYWEITSNQPLYTVDDSGGDIRISKPAGGNYEFQAAHIRFRPEVHGDFDVSVDFRDA
ncbi:MAG: hypothetical protein GTO29_08940 [Candidatus Latescibacteria bacterium]|nr:hypothetical protein [Candidatus Latescibacterota bacterium]NIO56289.1 hypothetical protein [Candidatus Latescibacterota bacterium]